MRGDGVAVVKVHRPARDEYLLALHGIGTQIGEAVEVISDLVIVHGVGEEIVDPRRSGGRRELARLTHVSVAAEGERAHRLSGDRPKNRRLGNERLGRKLRRRVCPHVDVRRIGKRS